MALPRSHLRYQEPVRALRGARSRSTRPTPQPTATGSKLHLWLTIAWASVGSTITVLAMSSVPWVSFMSLYANIVGHWSAYQAARGEEAQN